MCNTCAIFDAYQEHASASLDTLVSAVQGPFQVIVVALAGGWAIWIGIQIFVGTLDLATALKQIFFLVLGFGVFLGMQGGLIGEVFDASVNVMGGLSAEIMGGGGEGVSGLKALLQSVEDGIGGVFHIVSTIMSSGSWTQQIVNTVYGVALLIPYVILLVLFLAHAAVSLFRLTLICGMSPFLVGLAAFPFGRNLVGAGIRTIIGSIATMLCVTLVFSLVVKSVEALGFVTNADTDPSAFIDLSSGQFLLALIMGWLGAALISEAVNIAGQISSAVLGSVSAGIVAAGAIRGASMGASAARNAAGLTGRTATTARERLRASQRPRPGSISVPKQ